MLGRRKHDFHVLNYSMHNYIKKRGIIYENNIKSIANVDKGKGTNIYFLLIIEQLNLRRCVSNARVNLGKIMKPTLLVTLLVQ